MLVECLKPCICTKVSGVCVCVCRETVRETVNSKETSIQYPVSERVHIGLQARSLKMQTRAPQRHFNPG